MNQAVAVRVNELLKNIKKASAVKRLNFAHNLLSLLTLLSIITEFITQGVFCRYQAKLIKIAMQIVHIVMPLVIKKKVSYAIPVSILLAELFNGLLLYYAFVLHRENRALWLFLDNLIIYFYQGYLCLSIRDI